MPRNYACWIQKFVNFKRQYISSQHFCWIEQKLQLKSTENFVLFADPKKNIEFFFEKVLKFWIPDRERLF